MPNAVETVEREGKRHQGLQPNLQDDRECCKTCGQARGLQMPAEERCDKICGTKDVDYSRQSGTGDTVEGGKVPGYLWSVDAEMGGDGTLAALGGEDLVAGRWGDDFGCGWSGQRGWLVGSMVVKGFR